MRGREAWAEPGQLGEQAGALAAFHGHEPAGGLRSLEGRRVSLALRDGSRIDDCQLVSAARWGIDTMWVFSNGSDRFIALADVVDLWEARAA